MIRLCRMNRPPTRVRPGIARADRRELALIRDWLGRLDEEPLRAALAALLEVDGTGAPRERLTAIMGTLGLSAPTDSLDVAAACSQESLEGWSARRHAGGFVLRFVAADDGFELHVLGDTVRISAPVDPPTEPVDSDLVDGDLLEEALDASAGPVLRWLRTTGDRPAQASRLAALYAPRLRGSSWPSSHP